MKAAITGGAGFIGHHVVHALLARGDRVSVLDNFSTGNRNRLASLGAEVVVTEGNVLDPAALDAALAGCDVVIHLAAIASVAQSLVDPRLTDDVNVGGTIEVVLAAARAGVGRVVLAGSSAVYGIPDSLPCRETDRPEPRSPYGASKLAAEHYLHSVGRLHGVHTAALRFFNVYGPGQDPASEYSAVVPRFITAALDGRRPVINGSGDITRDFVYIGDVVDAILLAASPTGPLELTCNVASGLATDLHALLDAVSAAVGRRVEPVVGPPRPGDIPHSLADTSRAAEVLGFHARVPLAEGIARTVASLQAGAAPAGATDAVAT